MRIVSHVFVVARRLYTFMRIVSHLCAVAHLYTVMRMVSHICAVAHLYT